MTNKFNAKQAEALASQYNMAMSGEDKTLQKKLKQQLEKELNKKTALQTKLKEKLKNN